MKARLGKVRMNVLLSRRLRGSSNTVVTRARGNGVEVSGVGLHAPVPATLKYITSASGHSLRLQIYET